MSRLEDYHFRKDGVLFSFTIEAQPSPYKSKIQGRKVFDDVEVLNAVIPLSKNQANSTLVTPDLLERKGLEEEYAKWKAGEASAQKGTPITAFEALSPGLAKSLDAAGITTIEAFAEVDDGGLTALASLGPQIRGLRDKARLAVGYTDDAAVRALQEERTKMREEMETMKRELETLKRKPEPEEVKAQAQAASNKRAAA
jgi:hypothetical protein